MKKNIPLTLVMSLFLLSGCAFNKQAVELKTAPTAQTTCQIAGQGQSFLLDVVDDRENTSFGRRGSAYGPAAAISSTGDVVPTFRQGLVEKYANCGFNILSEETAKTKTIKVELRELSYATSVGFWSGGVHVQGIAKVRIKKNAKDYFEKMVRVEDEYRRAFVPTAKKNSEWINSIFNKLIVAIVDDGEIYQQMQHVDAVR